MRSFLKPKIINLALIIILSGCNTERTNFEIDRQYIGFWVETKWAYSFKSDGKYILESEGHGGGEPQIGTYVLKDSLILLIGETEYFEDWRFKRFKIDKQTNCLRDYWGYYYCASEEDLSEISERKFKEEQLIEKKIEDLTIVIDKRKELINQDSTKKYLLRNKGIIIEKGNEFYKYEIESWLPDYRRNQVHLRLFAKYDTFKIFDDGFNELKEINSNE